MKDSIIALLQGFSFFLLISCGSANTSFNEEDYIDLQELVNSGNFQVENSWANPLGGGNINLIGNPNFIKFDKDSVEVYLPYFGVRQSGGNYGGDGGIKYEGPLNNYKVSENRDRGYIELEFDAEKNNENLDFMLRLYPNKKARTEVVLSQRTSISYEGELSNTEND